MSKSLSKENSWRFAGSVVRIDIFFFGCLYNQCLWIQNLLTTINNSLLIDCMPTDLLVGLVSVMIDMIWRTTVTWTAGPIACKVVKYLQVNHIINMYLYTSITQWRNKEG